MSDIDIGDFVNYYLDDESYDYIDELIYADFDAIMFFDDYAEQRSDDFMTYLYKWRTTTGGCP